MSGGSGRSVDFDLHRTVGIRLINPSPRDAASVSRQLGSRGVRLAREPDIVIRFVDRLRRSSPVRTVGLGESAFTDDAFFITDDDMRLRARVPFEVLGEPAEIECTSGIGSVPLLVPIVNLTSLRKGKVPVHASAFRFRGRGVLTLGWAKGGKTETLLAFMAKGAEYVGDEWVYVSGDGDRVDGLAERIKIWDWHLREAPQYRRVLRAGERARLASMAAASGVVRAGASVPVRSFSQLSARLARVLGRQRFVHVSPERLFGLEACRESANLHTVLLVVNHDRRDVVVEPTATEEVVRRAAFSTEYERLPLLTRYLQFRFAFPERDNPLLSRVREMEQTHLAAALSGKNAYVVYHPFPAPIAALYEAVSPLL